MTRLVRIKTPALVDRLRGHLIDDDFEDDVLIAMTKERLSNDPDSVLLIYVLDEQKLVGFLLAVDAYKQPHTFIHQVWIHNNCSSIVAKKLLKAVQLWTIGIGKDEIRVETQRNASVFERRWGFTLFSKILSRKIDKEVKDEIFQA